MSMVRWMNAASRFLWLIGLIFIGIFIVFFVRPFDLPLPKGGPTAAQATDFKQALEIQAEHLDQNLEFIGKRDFFDFQVGLPAAGQGNDAAEEQSMPDASTDFLGRYKLVGIIVDAKEQAVFESLSDGSVVFLDKGASLDRYVLKSVSPGEVVLDDQGSLIKVKLLNQP